MKKSIAVDNIPILSLISHEGRPAMQIACGECDGTDVQFVKSVTVGPNAYLNHWKKLKWKIYGDGKKAVCPVCIKRQSEEKRERKLANKREKERESLLRACEKMLLEVDEAVAQAEGGELQGAVLSQSMEIFNEDLSRYKHHASKLFEETEGIYTTLKEISDRIVHLEAVALAAERREEEPEEVDEEDAEFRQMVLENLHDMTDAERRSYLRSFGLDEETVQSWGAGPQVPESDIPVRKQFQLFKLFEEHIQDGAYQYGWSDAKCAEEVDLPVEQVRAIRFETVGEVESFAVIEAQKALRACEEQFKRDYQELQMMLESCKEDYEKRHKQLVDELEAALKEKEG